MTTSNVLTRNTSHLALLPWFMWSCGALFYFYEFLIQVSPNVMGPQLMTDLSITANQLGSLSGVFFYAYAAMQMPAGILLDKLGPRRLLAMASAILASGCILFASAQFLNMAIFARFLMGLGSAFAIIGCMKIAANWFAPNRFGLLIGLTVTIGMIGAIVGEAPLAHFLEYYHWRHSMLYLSFIGGGLCLLFLLLVRDYPSVPINPSSSQSQSFMEVLVGLRHVIVSKQMWCVAIYGCLMFAPTITFCGLWGGPFLALKHHIDGKYAAAIASMVFVGWAIGSPLTGWISDRIGKRKPTMVVGAIGACLLLSMVLYVHVPPLVSAMALFGFGALSSGFLPAFSIIRESSPAHCEASALGFMNTLNTLGIALLQPLVGIFIHTIWDGQLLASRPDYQLIDYQYSMLALPLTLLIAWILTFYIDETYCQIKDHAGH